MRGRHRTSGSGKEIGLSHSEKAMGMLREHGMLRPGDLQSEGIPSSVVSRLIRRGKIRPVRSLDEILIGYMLQETEAPSLQDDAIWEIPARHPRAILCLQSALRHHDLTDGYTSDFVAAVPPNVNRRSLIRGARLITWSNPDMFTVGIMKVALTKGFEVRMTDVSRTLADLYRPEHGIPEAVREQAIGVVLSRHGDAALTKASEHAAALGWLKHISGPLSAARGAIKWSATRKP